MPAVTPTPVDDLPTPPQTTDIANFDARADAYLAALLPHTDQMNDLADDTYTNAVFAESQATSASGSASSASASAAAALASAASAVNAPGTSGTSTTSTAVGTGSKTLTTQTGKLWSVGQTVTIARTSDPAATRMSGAITAYNSGSGSITVLVNNYAGSGTFTDWTISIGGMPFTSVLPSTAITSSGTTAASVNADYLLDSNSITLTAPTSKAVGDLFQYQLMNSRTGCSVDFGSDKAWGRTPGVMTLDNENDRAKLKWSGSTYGWVQA